MDLTFTVEYASSVIANTVPSQARLIRKQQVEVADGQKKLESLLIRLCGSRTSNDG